MRTLTKQALEYAKTRGISEQTLTRQRVLGGPARFQDGAHEAIVFAYWRGEKLVNYKARSIEGKRYVQMQGGEQIAYGWEEVQSGPLEDVWIVEGEIDALSLIEAGVPPHSVLSVPGGAPADASDDPEQSRRYGWLLDAVKNGLGRARRLILATDGDDPGRALRSDCTRILGPARTWYLDWPEGIKDANEMLVKNGTAALRAHLATAKPWPVTGIYQLSDIPEPTALELWDIGFPEISGRIKIAPTTLSVVTGFPGHGKSHVFQQVWYQIAQRYDIRVAIFSAETRLKPFLRRNFRQFYWNRREVTLSDAERREADDWIQDRIFFIDAGDRQPTMSWMLEMAEIAAQRHGCRAIVIDPWNKIEEDYDPRQETETRWIGRMLDLWIEMARGLNIHTQIIAHPAKPDTASRSNPPDLYSISGSQHWANRVDQGFCIWRKKIVEGGVQQTESEIRLLKTRYEDLGFPAKYPLNYDVEKGIFYSTETETELETALKNI